jgi:hypothetical protein
VIVKEEHPNIPIGDQVKLCGWGIGMGIGAKQGVVVGIEGALVPDRGTVGFLLGTKYSHLVGPSLGMDSGGFEVRIETCRPRHIKIWEFKRWHDLGVTCFQVFWMSSSY